MPTFRRVHTRAFSLANALCRAHTSGAAGHRAAHAPRRRLAQHEFEAIGRLRDLVALAGASGRSRRSARASIARNDRPMRVRHSSGLVIAGRDKVGGRGAETRTPRPATLTRPVRDAKKATDFKRSAQDDEIVGVF